MEEFKQTYFEECEDRLQEAEEGLSVMLDDNSNEDIINQVFRAIHSIKGGAGAFGFKRLVEFTHEFETTLDRVRDGSLIPDRDTCNLFLTANDIVASLIEQERNNDAIDEAYGEEILIKLSAVRGEDDGDEGDVGQIDTLQEFYDVTENSFSWSIIFRPNADILNTGNDPYHILLALAELGKLEVTVEEDNLPNFADMSINHCYLVWRCILNTSATEEDIRDVFLFVDDLC
jgi:two-component system chemotaxis sensor kinase CheA